MQTILEFEKENVGSAQVREVCDKLQKDSLKALSLRECVLTDKDFKRILKWVAGCANLRHLSLNIGILPDTFRVHVLAQTLQKNKSLTGLFIHGNEIGEAGVKILHPSLVRHPRLLSLDVGDCGIGDEGLELLSQLLVQRHGHPGLEELVLSSNPGISARGWAKLGVAISAGCNLRSLYVDYNELGDSSASCLLVATAAAKSLETLDMECVGATESTAQVLLHLVQNYSVSFTNVNLDENDITEATLEAIKTHIPGVMGDDLSNGIHSDEEHSLATSEPPLDPNCDLEEFSSPVNRITIVGETDSPVYTPDDIVTDGRIVMTEQTPNDTEKDINVTTVTEAENVVQTESGLSSKTEIKEMGEDKNEKADEEKTGEDGRPDKDLQAKTDDLKKRTGKRKSSTKNVSLADRIKVQRDKNVINGQIPVITAVEKEAQGCGHLKQSSLEDEAGKNEKTAGECAQIESKSKDTAVSGGIVVVTPIERLEDLNEKKIQECGQFEQSQQEDTTDINEKTAEECTQIESKSKDTTINGSLAVVTSIEGLEQNNERKIQAKAVPKIQSFEVIEDIEEMNEHSINEAHDNLIVPGTPSKMSLCSGPGVKSTTSIFEDNQFLQIAPSNSKIMNRRYSHNIEINEEAKMNLQGIAKHRGSEGNISVKITNRRGSVPNAARLTVHGVGSTTNMDELNAFGTRRRLSNASTLGDVDIDRFQ